MHQLTVKQGVVMTAEQNVDHGSCFRCEAVNKANLESPVAKTVELDVFFPPKSLRILVGRPESEGTYDRTQEYEDRKHLLSFNRKPVRDENIHLVLEGERVQLICEAGRIYHKSFDFFAIIGGGH